MDQLIMAPARITHMSHLKFMCHIMFVYAPFGDTQAIGIKTVLAVP